MGTPTGLESRRRIKPGISSSNLTRTGSPSMLNRMSPARSPARSDGEPGRTPDTNAPLSSAAALPFFNSG
jgi:hypothetical protein